MKGSSKAKEFAIIAPPKLAMLQYLDELLHEATTESLTQTIEKQAPKNLHEYMDANFNGIQEHQHEFVKENKNVEKVESVDQVVTQQTKTADTKQKNPSKQLSLKELSSKENILNDASPTTAKTEEKPSNQLDNKIIGEEEKNTKKSSVKEETLNQRTETNVINDKNNEQIAIDYAALMEWQENGRPGWAQERFDCLLFKVDGLALAVPLVLLGNIHQLDKELTPLFEMPPWFVGLLSLTNQPSIKVVDTSQLVMPEKLSQENRDDLKYAIGIHGSDWGMACHEIIGSITLELDEVKWRKVRTSRPWLAGTVIEKMCALIDINAFAYCLLEKQQ